MFPYEFGVAAKAGPATAATPWGTPNEKLIIYYYLVVLWPISSTWLSISSDQECTILHITSLHLPWIIKRT
uniref:Uncharacterized protein n=1 Tax=Arundo donax TaxID=35708 RepID=A0A0A8XUJ9_ARUDO